MKRTSDLRGKVSRDSRLGRRRKRGGLEISPAIKARLGPANVHLVISCIARGRGIRSLQLLDEHSFDRRTMFVNPRNQFDPCNVPYRGWVSCRHEGTLHAAQIPVTLLHCCSDCSIVNQLDADCWEYRVVYQPE